MRSKIFIFTLGIGMMMMGLGVINYLTAGSAVAPAWNEAAVVSQEDVDHVVGTAVKIADEKGNVISQVCRGVVAGDEIINSEGNHYRITRVDKDKAFAKSLGVDKDFLAWNDFLTDDRLAMAAATRKQGTVGVYHTHTDEAYVPTDGTESVPFKGGIYDVGKTLVQRLREKNGTEVAYDKTPHDPHDNAAYQRSRRTAMNLLKQNPMALIDVHRDGIPDPDYYRANVSNEDVSKLRIVVGRQNPNMQANLDFARKMMAYANKVHPKIVKEIFMAKGNYNQDLMPTAILIEAGTHTNTKEEAERGVALFADAVPAVLGIQGGPTAPTGQGPTVTPGGGATGSGAWKAVGWIVGLSLLLGGGFMLMSSGSLKGLREGLAGFGKEFTNYLGPIKKRLVRKPLPGKGRAGKKSTEEANQAAIDHRNDVTED
ncbi:stage II sporulation protein P [Desulforamulus ruminis]|uniref:Stage II sporulation protein P n=1 Tax=Desulforamulus ruminis (strain ATCC 23193 / DSM 2154 / NCIMB 8452 / DL) TaxID=696281 RepID=F6DT47_DESRL|nr:stage II sporulation protein P [Desulforamulus ruminis]AEG61152.1 stage II sporulation protein P [Desulforamulus ruminis DSM 2154]